jgi:hypothetical protein
VKKIFTISLLSVLALVLTACGAAAGSSQSNTQPDNSSGSSASGAGSSGSSNPAPDNGTPSSGPSALQLAAGMLKLDGTSNAVTAQQAAQLLPLYQSLQQAMSTPVAQATPDGTTTPGSRFSQAMMQEMDTQMTAIQNAMTPAQIQAITAMNLSREDINTVFQQAGISMGGPGQGGFGSNGGTFTPPSGTPRAPGTPGAFLGNGGGNFNGGRRGFGNFLPSGVVDGIVQYLQKKAGS